MTVFPKAVFGMEVAVFTVNTVEQCSFESALFLPWFSPWGSFGLWGIGGHNCPASVIP